MTIDDPRAWYIKFGSVLGVLLLMYVILHLQWKGDEIVNFSKEEITDIQTIVDKSGLDTLSKTSLSAQYASRSDTVLARINNYIRSRYDLADTNRHQRFMSSYVDAGFPITFLPQYKLKVDSFFWLTESKAFLEIIFWTWFGVLASLFYYVSEALSKNTFAADEEYIHWSKLLYAPITALVIYFSLNSLVGKNEVNLNNLRHGLLILSFLLGFFSGRMIELLSKIKNLFFPSQEDSASRTSPPGTPTSAPSEASETIYDEATSEEKSTAG
jgi:hypothetical protein